jgi:uncharacterized protein
MNNKLLLTFTLAITGLIIFSFSTGLDLNKTKRVKIYIAAQVIDAEIADTITARRRGLSNQESLAAGTGMLFVFDKPGNYQFWMKEMQLPLDIIWILDDTVVDIWPLAPVPTDSNIPRYTPLAPANFVLELNAGFSEVNDLRIGDKVIVDTDLN